MSFKIYIVKYFIQPSILIRRIRFPNCRKYPLNLKCLKGLHPAIKIEVSEKFSSGLTCVLEDKLYNVLCIYLSFILYAIENFKKNTFFRQFWWVLMFFHSSSFARIDS